MGKHNLKPQQIEAVRLVISGLTYEEVAKELGVCKNTIGNWMRSDDVNAEYVKQMKDVIRHGFNKAIKTLSKQTTSDNEWIAQGASRELVGRYGAAILGDDRQEITVHITGGIPVVGMPERSEDDET